jgi:tetratricopeptide (TPR) repeat protein
MHNPKKSPDVRYILLLVAGVLMLSLRPTPTQQVIRQNAQSGYRALEAGQTDQAYRALASAVMAEPGLGSLHLILARLALLTGNPKSAADHLQQAEAWGTPPSELFCITTVIELWDSGLEGMQPSSLPDGSDCEPAYLILKTRIRQLVEENQWQVADDLIQVSLAWELYDLAILTDLGVLQAIVDPDQAIDILTRANGPADLHDPVALGLIRAIEDSRPEANPAYTLAQVGQSLARFGMWQEAVWAFQHALEIDSEYVEARAYLGLALDQIGEDGYQHLAAAESAYPNAALPHLFLGMHWSSRGELSRAQLELEIAAGLERTNPSIWVELGSVYAQQGMVAEARSAFIQAVSLTPDEWEFWFLLAQFSLNLEIEIADLALPAARNLITLDPSDPRSYDLLGYAHFLNGNMQLAERLLLKSISLQPSLASAHYHLGQLRRWQGRAEQSQAAFELALQLDPQGPVGDLARRALGLP